MKKTCLSDCLSEELSNDNHVCMCVFKVQPTAKVLRRRGLVTA